MHNQVGEAGEKIAEQWLLKQGFTILHRNWRHAHDEIDIIATRGKMLHFIEVKTRSSKRFGHPEHNVSQKKFKQLKRAADAFLFANPGYRWIQFDIVAITIKKENEAEVFYMEDVS